MQCLPLMVGVLQEPSSSELRCSFHLHKARSPQTLCSITMWEYLLLHAEHYGLPGVSWRSSWDERVQLWCCSVLVHVGRLPMGSVGCARNGVGSTVRVVRQQPVSIRGAVHTARCGSERRCYKCSIPRVPSSILQHEGHPAAIVDLARRRRRGSRGCDLLLQEGRSEEHCYCGRCLGQYGTVLCRHVKL